MIQGDGKSRTLIFHRRRTAQGDGKMRPRGARSPSADHHAGVQDPGARVSSGVNTITRRRASSRGRGGCASSWDVEDEETTTSGNQLLDPSQTFPGHLEAPPKLCWRGSRSWFHLPESGMCRSGKLLFQTYFNSGETKQASNQNPEGGRTKNAETLLLWWQQLKAEPPCRLLFSC